MSGQRVPQCGRRCGLCRCVWTCVNICVRGGPSGLVFCAWRPGRVGEVTLGHWWWRQDSRDPQEARVKGVEGARQLALPGLPGWAAHMGTPGWWSQVSTFSSQLDRTGQDHPGLWVDTWPASLQSHFINSQYGRGGGLGESRDRETETEREGAVGGG